MRRLTTNRLKLLFIVLAAFAASSCGASATYYASPVRPTHTLWARIWVKEDPLMPASAGLNGCRFWESKGLLCSVVSDPAQANVRVIADHVACGQGDSKIEPESSSVAYALPADAGADYALAKAWHDGTIKVFTACLAKSGDDDPEDLVLVIAHEIGHQLGIWKHVPEDCADKKAEIKVHPSGRRVCGAAIMNPHHFSGAEAITELDAMAFDLRDTVDSPIDRLGAAPAPTVEPRTGPRKLFLDRPPVPSRP